ncbi:MAG: hypothetical protein H6712_17710 [Myxococcales bacterium]|nr:hypothetical protein [Myxococcales bacterium]MCB9715711.1 hypothetical protein [Myxococcales bacterium]
MSDRRWSLDELVAAAREHDRPSERARRRGWAAIEAAIAAGPVPPEGSGGGSGGGQASTGGAAGSAAASSSAISGTTIGLAVVVVASVVGLAGVWREPAATPRPRPPTAIERAPTVGSSEVMVSGPSSEVGTETASPPVAPRSAEAEAVEAAPEHHRARRPVRVEPATAAPEVAPISRPDSLVEQARVLGQAWKAMDEGDHERALVLVRRHALRFPESPLAPEREACRMIARCLRHEPSATTEARDYLRRNPRAPHAARVERACGVDEPNGDPQ